MTDDVNAALERLAVLADGSNPGGTHWETCYNDPAHLKCRVHHDIDIVRAALAEKDELIQTRDNEIAEMYAREIALERERDKALAAVGTLRESLCEAREMLEWQTDDDADLRDESPEDMVAHVNGLVRRCLAAALAATADPGNVVARLKAEALREELPGIVKEALSMCRVDNEWRDGGVDAAEIALTDVGNARADALEKEGS